MEMEKHQQRVYKAHCLVFPYPSQGHINPLLQFAKVLDHKGVKVTLVTTRFIYNTMYRDSCCASLRTISLETISDGFDEGGCKTPGVNDEVYLESFWKVGSQTLCDLIEKLSTSGCPVDCIVYDAFMPWPLDIAKKFGLVGAVFVTQSCAVANIYNHFNKGLLNLPLADDVTEVSLPGMQPLQPKDLPSFLSDFGSNPAFFEVVTNQFLNIDKADWVLWNTFHELEEQVVNWLAKFWKVRTIGPTIPSNYLDNRLENDKEYGIDLFKSNNDVCMKWLSNHPRNSVTYVSFGSAAKLGLEQMEELAWGLLNRKFLWVVRESEAAKVPEGFIEKSNKNGLVVSWCSQLEVLAHEAVGCFVTHCGWNSTLESLSLGVPIVAMPQWTDQSTSAKFITDVWGIGVKVNPDENGIVRREEVEHCISEIMEGEKGEEIQRNAMKWKDLAQKATVEGGSSNRNVDEFIAGLVKH